MPDITITSCHRLHASITVIYRQVQRNNTVTASSIGKEMRWYIRTIRVIGVPPSKAVASSSSSVACATVIDRFSVTTLSHPATLVKVCVGEAEAVYSVPYHVKLSQTVTLVSPVLL